MAHRFPIGTQYLDRNGKHGNLCTVTEQLTTRNSRGEVVREFYWSTHPMMLVGTLVTDHDVVDVTIARGVGALIAQRLRDVRSADYSPADLRRIAAERIADELGVPTSVREACVSFAMFATAP
jgi:hypothetical protein